MTDERHPMEVAVDLGRALEAQGIPYAIGGALAFGMWGRPRFTADIDVNVFIQVDELDSLVGAFEDAGVSWEPTEARRRASAEGMFVAWAGSFRVDVFTPSIPYSWQALQTRVQLEARGAKIWFLGPEATAVFKLLFFRGKDVEDLRVLLRVQGARLDVRHVASAVADVVGDDDERLRTWSRLVDEAGLRNSP